MKSTTWLNDNIKPVLSLCVCVLSFFYFFYCVVTSVAPNPQILIAIVASLGNVLNYWFGSSSGSAKKDEVIAAQQAPPVASTQSGDITVK